MRTIATSVPVEGGDCILASVRTARPIPLDKVRAVMDMLRDMTLEAPVRIGQVVANGPAGTDTEIVATRNVKKI
jgi:CxxC motif-containing protein